MVLRADLDSGSVVHLAEDAPDMMLRTIFAQETTVAPVGVIAAQLRLTVIHGSSTTLQ